MGPLAGYPKRNGAVIHCDLVYNKDLGFFEGQVFGHPCPDINLRAYTTSHGERFVSLWEYGHEVGKGLLRQCDGMWKGVCQEYAGIWHLTAQVGSARVEFREKTDD